jgi:hypothetical protein
LREVAWVRTTTLVRKTRQSVSKCQPTTAVLRATPITVDARANPHRPTPGPRFRKKVWLVEVRLENVALAPWRLLTDWPVETEADALRVFRMYRERWAGEDCFKFTEDVLGGEDV